MAFAKGIVVIFSKKIKIYNQMKLLHLPFIKVYKK
jgi:hypothetical protein